MITTVEKLWEEEENKINITRRRETNKYKRQNKKYKLDKSRAWEGGSFNRWFVSSIHPILQTTNSHHPLVK